MADRRFYLRVPIPSRHGDDWDFITVDLTRLGPEILTEIYERVSEGGRDGRNDYRPALGAEGIVRSGVDPQIVLQELEERLAECRDALGPYAQTGVTVQEQILDPLSAMASLVNLIAASRPEAARDALRDLMYQIMGGVCAIATSLHAQETTVDGMTAAVETLDTTLGRKGDIMDRFYLDWAEAADTLVRRVTRLSEIETLLRALREEVSSRRTQWEQTLGSSAPTIASAIQCLDGDGNNFLIRAFDYQKGRGARPDLESAIREARHHMTLTDQATAWPRSEWRALQERIAREILPLQAEIERLCFDMAASTGRLRDFERWFGEGTARPYLVHDGGLISESDYRKALGLLRDPLWAPQGARERLTALLGSGPVLLGDIPTLPERLVDARGQAEEYIAEIERQWRESDRQPTGPIAISALEAASAGSTETPINGLDPERIERLYMLTVCVAYVLTCKPIPMAQSNVRAMLLVVQHLGLCSEAEVAAYQVAVQRRVQDDEIEDVERHGQVTECWRQSPARWLSCVPIGHAVPSQSGSSLKLTQQSGSIARAWMSTLGLTDEKIRQAHKRKRDAQYLGKRG